MEKILFVNACVRPVSRSCELAQTVLELLHGEVEEVRLYEERIQPLDLCALESRDECVRTGDFSDSAFLYAKQFASADTIVIAAPYWDLLFPAVLRTYLETVTVTGLTFRYTPQGFPQGLCRAKRLIDVTTSGGPVGDRNYGYEYVKALANTFYGISDVQCFMAEGLDIAGADTKELMKKAKDHIAEMLGA